MATVDILAAFGYKWGQDGTVETLDEAQYKAGWSFIGATPPSVEQFNKVHQIQDEKSNYLYEQMVAIYAAAGVAPAAGTLTSLRQSLRRMLGGNVTGLIAGSTVLTADNAGLIIVNAAAGNVSITLPAANGVQGAPFKFRRIDTSANTVTVSRAGANTIDEGITSFTLIGQGDVREIASDGVSSWRSIVGPNSALKTATGYMKFPNGIILQWGGVNAGNGTLVTLPIAFPNAVVSNICTLASNGSIGTLISTVEVTNTSLTGFRLYVSAQAPSGGAWATSTHSVSWIAIGY